jgi:hypothetical protein
METETPPSNDDGSCAAAAEVPSARPLRTGLATVALLASYAAIAIYAIHVELPPDPLSLPLEPQVRDIVQSVLPEGWNFFTRNPRESRLYALAPDRNGQWSSAMKGPNAEPANMFGGNRMARAQGRLVVKSPRSASQPVVRWDRRRIGCLVRRYAVTWGWCNKSHSHSPGRAHATTLQCPAGSQGCTSHARPDSGCSGALDCRRAVDECLWTCSKPSSLVYATNAGAESRPRPLPPSRGRS